MLKSYESLKSINLVEERDNEILHEEIGRFFWRWTYPSIDNDIRLFIEKLLLKSITTSSSYHELDDLNFYKIRKTWVYILSHPSRKFYIILLANDFYPYHYKSLLALFANLYQDGFPMNKLLHYYLTLMIEERIIIDGKLRFSNADKENQNQKPISIELRSIIKLFSLDVILIYTALLLKKRIVLYHHDRQILFDFALKLPDFIPHRSETLHNVFVPNVDLHCQEQIKDLKARHHFISTFNDPRIEEHEDLYDVYINLAAVEITISHKAKEIFHMTKTHKDVAQSLVRIAEKEDTTESDIKNEIIKKTKELINVLNLLIEPETLLIRNKLKEKITSPNLEQFFWNLAIAEGYAVNSNKISEKDDNLD